MPKRVNEFTNITCRTLAAIICGFNDTMTALVEILHNEQVCDRSSYHRTGWLFI